jgi:hypothetical protein
LIKKLNKYIKGNYFNTIKVVCEKPTANIVFSGGRWQLLLLK